MPKPSFSVAQMDADWGSSSDEETTAERAARDAAKLQETMALLAQFEKTREPEKQNYGAMDAGNLLKPMLARGELRCIGATTLDEYQKYMEKDPALERRFQQVRSTLVRGLDRRPRT